MPYKNKVQQKEAQRRHYLTNKQKYAASRSKNKSARAAWVQEIKSKLQCKSCGFKDWRCLDFHHRNPSEKFKGICLMVRDGYSEDAILAEINKCDVLCANCHNEHHYGECSPSEYNKREWFRAYKESLACEHCGVKKSPCLVFHHLGDKKATLNALTRNGTTLAVILEEIAKCQVLCFNCHRIVHGEMSL